MTKYAAPLIFSVLSLTAAIVAFGQDNTFYRKYNLSGMQGGLQLEETSDGGFVATGQHEDNGSLGGCDIYIYRVDECGNTLWFRLYGTSSSEGGKSIKQTNDDGFIVSGHYAGSIGFNLKLNSDGDVEWAKTYPALTWVFYSEQTANNDYICLGQGNGGLYLFRTNSTGDVIWSRFMSGLGNMGFYVSELSNGDFIFTSSSGISGRDIAVGRVTANGDPVWMNGYGNGWSDQDGSSWACKGLIDEPDSSIVVTSPTQSGMGADDVLFMKLDIDDGSVRWANAYGGNGSDQSRDIAKHLDGYAIVGNTNSFSVSVGSNPDLVENMAERDVLLVNVDHDGEIIWSRTYGGDNRDRGIGVKFNASDSSFIMSAFSNSTFFGNGGAMDPVFIRTDSLGFVNCQTHSPSLVRMTLNPPSSPLGSLSPSSISASPVTMGQATFNVNDVYLCQDCLTEPLFEPSDTMICVNEPVFFYNTTEVGLTCFQEWLINGQAFNGGIDTLTYQFASPGDYPVLLYSSCGGQSTSFETAIHVFEVEATLTGTSDFNGYGVSCTGYNNGSIQTSAQGGYLPGNASYQLQWTPFLPGNLNVGNLFAGTYTLAVSDVIGCTDSVVVTITEPPPLDVVASPASNYNGFGVSCFDGQNGSIQALATGGVGNYQYTWNTVPPLNAAIVGGQSAGFYTVQVLDGNSCLVSDATTLTEPPPLGVQLDVLTDYNGYDVSCFQGSDAQVSVTANGGTGSYTMTWNGQAVPGGGVIGPISAQDLVIHVSDLNACQVQIQGVLNEPPPLQSVLNVISNYNGAQISCPDAADGQASAQISGGVFPYLYTWADGSVTSQSFADLDAGYNFIAVTDANGCAIEDSVFLSEPLPLELTASVLTNYNGFGVSCYGASDGGLQSQGQFGTQPYTYSWSGNLLGNVQINLPEGNYTAFANDANLCGVVAVPVQLSQPSDLVIDSFVLSDYNGYSVACFGGSNGTVSTSVSGSVAPYNIVWSNGDTGLSADALPAGNVQVSVVDLNGCSESSQVLLTQPTALQLSASVTSDYNGFGVSCTDASDGSAQAAASGAVGPYSYWWSDQTVGNTADNLSAQSYTAFVTDLNQCDTLSASVIPTEPSPLLIDGYVFSDYNGFEISCPGSTDGVASVLLSGSVPPYQVVWSNGDSGIVSDGLPAGVVSVNVMDDNGCVTDGSAALNEPIPLDLSAVITTDYNGYGVSCFDAADGGGVSQGSGGVLPLQYWWSDGTQGTLLSGAEAGVYEAYLTDANHCDTLSAPITLTQPTPLVIGDFVLSDYNGFPVSCFGFSDATATASVSGSVPPYALIWSNGDLGPDADLLPAGMVSLAVTDLNGCTLSSSEIINQPLPIEVDVWITTDYNGFEISCYGASDGAAMAQGSGGVGPYSYSWTGGQSGDTIDGLSAQSYSVTMTDANQCPPVSASTTPSQPTPLTIDGFDLSNYNGFPVSCPGVNDGQATALVSGSVPPYQYLWSNGDSGQLADLLPAGVVSVDVEDANGCVIAGQTELNEPTPISLTSLVTSDYSGYGVSCFGAVDGSASSQGSGGSQPHVFWWSNGTVSESLSGAGAGNYNAFMTDANQCDTLAVPLVITEPPPFDTPQYLISDFNGYSVSCYGASDAQVECSITGAVPPYTIVWSNGDAGASATDLEAGDVSYVAVDQNGCVFSDEIELSEPPLIEIEYLVAPDTCRSEVGEAEITVVGGVPAYLVEWDDGQIGPLGCCLLAGTHPFHITDENGCGRSFSVDVPNLESPVPSFSWRTEPFCSGESVARFSDESAGDPILFEWSFGDGRTATGRNPSHVYMEPGDYMVHLAIENQFGCREETEMSVRVFPDLRVFMPNTFTPDQNGLNESFGPQGSGIKSYRLMVFNRWGDQVFESSELTPRWNGSVDNLNGFSEQGVYSWRLIAEGYCGSKEMTGHVVMLR